VPQQPRATQRTGRPAVRPGGARRACGSACGGGGGSGTGRLRHVTYRKLRRFKRSKWPRAPRPAHGSLPRHESSPRAVKSPRATQARAKQARPRAAPREGHTGSGQAASGSRPALRLLAPAPRLRHALSVSRDSAGALFDHTPSLIHVHAHSLCPAQSLFLSLRERLVTFQKR
jgi:hypothetical protein